MTTQSPVQNDPVVKVDNVSKKFCMNLRRSMVYGIVDLSKNLLGNRPDSITIRKDEFWALDNIRFELRRGEVLGLIGMNGSGKTTLLRLLAGIFPPDKGGIMIRGRVGALIAIGAGFHPHMTGRENIYLNGIILGMTREEIDAKFDDIVDFAAIKDFLDAPVSTYSSGMRVRLGFSIAVQMEPDVLLIDEVLAVGDMAFKAKCQRKISWLIKKGTTIILVSHDMNSIKKNCHRVLLLDRGKLVDSGEPKEIIDLYNAIAFERIAAEIKGKNGLAASDLAARRQAGESQRYGSLQAEITEVTLFDGDDKPIHSIHSMEPSKIKIIAVFHEDIKDILVGISIRNKLGIDVYMINTDWKRVNIPIVRKGTKIAVTFSQKMALNQGTYLLTVALSQNTAKGIKRLDWVSDMLLFDVLNSEEVGGVCNLDSAIVVEQNYDRN